MQFTCRCTGTNVHVTARVHVDKTLTYQEEVNCNGATSMYIYNMQKNTERLN
jgi:hypothetical protein